MATQIAVARGALVIGTCSEPNHDLLRSLGGEPTVYGAGLGERVRDLASEGVDAVLDLSGGDALSVSGELLRTPGRIVSVVDPGVKDALDGVYVFVRPDTVQLRALGELAEAGRLRAVVQSVHDLDDVRGAIEAAYAARSCSGSRERDRLTEIVDVRSVGGGAEAERRVAFSPAADPVIGDAAHMFDDPERCARAVRSKDARFDGWFFVAVTSTGIYCRPSCPATTPKRENMRFHPSAAAAQRAGFRACRRCRPDASPGSPAWDHRSDVAARAMRSIADGVVDRAGVAGLASSLGYSVRQVERHLLAEVGAGPLALARAQRAQTARLLIETTALPMSEVAFAAGFASIRTFNDTVREVFARAPTELRRRASGERRPLSTGTLALRLPFRAPLWPDSLFGHLVATAVPGVEEWRDARYRRTLRLPHGHGIVALWPRADHVRCQLALTDLRDLTVAITRCRRLLDLDADPVAVDTHLGADPALAPWIAGARGRRVPRTVDVHELAVRAVLGQQVSTAAARTHAGRLVEAHGDRIEDPTGGLSHLFPEPAALAELSPGSLKMPGGRRTALQALTTALASRELDLASSCDWQDARRALLALPGIGPWTVETIAMRGLGDPDAFLPTDLGVRVAARRLGLAETPAALSRRASSWRPWRAYAVQHLWATGDHEINRYPAHERTA